MGSRVLFMSKPIPFTHLSVSSFYLDLMGSYITFLWLSKCWLCCAGFSPALSWIIVLLVRKWSTIYGYKTIKNILSFDISFPSILKCRLNYSDHLHLNKLCHSSMSMMEDYIISLPNVVFAEQLSKHTVRIPFPINNHYYFVVYHQ